MKLLNCCGKEPLTGDVGGFNAEYEITCPVCEKVVNAPTKAKAEHIWNTIIKAYREVKR